MYQWLYCSLRWNNDGNLFRLSYHDNGITYETIPLDPLIDGNDPSITIRRWLASLGRQGWELTAILRDEEGQEWVLKRPVMEGE
jgi:hypothetical protein